MILLECCCGRPVPPEPIGCVFNHPVVMSCLIWAVVVVVFGVLLFVYMIEKDKLKRKEFKDAREQELNLKEMAFEKEKYWREKGLEDKEKALDLRIKEFEELTLRQKLLDKVVEKRTDEKLADLKKELETLQKKYESLDGEIEQIIIKKKQ